MIDPECYCQRAGATELKFTTKNTELLDSSTPHINTRSYMSYKVWYIANHCINYFAIIQIDSFIIHLNFELTLTLLLLVFLPSLLRLISTHFQFHPLTKYNWLIHVNWTIIVHIFTLLSLNIILNLNISAWRFQIDLILPCHFSNFKISHSPSKLIVDFFLWIFLY